jgi:4-hydroxy 2-oxovalerate aldolase/long-chain acyl-CoA synthetase
MDKSTKKIDILDCTLRDGSYAIDYQFTAEDTAIIASGLEDAGFRFIEVGHGLGLNASSSKYGISASTDKEYLEAASSVLKNSKYGMFFIPGIGRTQDIDIAANYGMGFIRIGTNAIEIEEAEPYIKRSKNVGMMVFSNLMKSYALPINDFIKKAKLAKDYGADVIVIVDSAGGMLPDEVNAYVSRVVNDIDITVGFHGHNNLQLAIANTIEAVKAGAIIVDSSLQGMGRSAGNAQTELLIMVLERLGYDINIDLFKAMDLGEKIVKPMMGGEKGIDSISATLGYAQFHSSFLKIIYKIAQKYNIDPRDLIIRTSEIEKSNIKEELVEDLALKVKKEANDSRLFWNINYNFKNIDFENRTLGNIAKTVALELVSLSKKTGKQSIFTIAGTLNKNMKKSSFPFIRQNIAYIIGNAEVVSINQAIEIANSIDGYIDYILVDVDNPNGYFQDLYKDINNTVKKSIVLPYKDSDAHVNAIDSFLAQILHDIINVRIIIIGNNSMSEKLSVKLKERGAVVIKKDKNAVLENETSDVIVALTPYEYSVNISMVQSLTKNSIIIDAGPGCIRKDVIEYINNAGICIYRIDMRAGLSGEVINVIETYELTSKIMGKRQINGVNVVAGGYIGKKGDIVVDSIAAPGRVIGVADGKGKLIAVNETYQYVDLIKKVKLGIAEERYARKF